MSYANLHIHTYFSDGTTSPSGLMQKIYGTKNLDYFALTDHDTLSGIEPVFRLKKKFECDELYPVKKFIPGIELSLKEASTGLAVHLLGLFPEIDEQNYGVELQRLDAILGDFCKYRCIHRGIVDMDARIRHAFLENLDGIGDRYDSPDDVITILRGKAERIQASRFQAAEKNGDIIQYPSPQSYQMIIDYWEELVPSSSREKISLYILRPEQRRKARLAGIYMAEGVAESRARALADENQGILSKCERPALKEMEILEGLALLQQAGAITILAHPAVDHYRIGYDEFDRSITFPLIDRGLDGLEVFYPYDMAYREEVFLHYGGIARRCGLLVSGGTDFHGDGRVGLDDVRLCAEKAERIIQQKRRSHHHEFSSNSHM